MARANATVAAGSQTEWQRAPAAVRSHPSSANADAVAQNTPGASDMMTMEDNIACPPSATIRPAADAMLLAAYGGSAPPLASAIQYTSGASAAPVTMLASCAPSGAP